jgi:hypothetical protein
MCVLQHEIFILLQKEYFLRQYFKNTSTESLSTALALVLMPLWINSVISTVFRFCIWHFRETVPVGTAITLVLMPL